VEIRSYNPETDFDGVARIWREIGWIESGNENQDKGLELFAEQYDSLVAIVDGSPECFVSTGMGSMRYLNRDLALSVVTAVNTGHVARRQGLARKLTAKAIANDAEAGAVVSALGMFDQGYYNRLGFGTGTYEYWHSIDPASLRVPVTPRPPKRLGVDDWEAIHRSRHNRLRGHGSCVIDAGAATEAELLWAENGFGLGYPDGPNGELTHLLWFSTKGMEFGPLNAWFMTYQNTDQFLELMALLVQLGDNVQLVRMREPADIQLQDLIHQPFRRRRMTEKSDYENRVRAAAYWQVRMCDVKACVAAAKLPGEPVRFNLKLTDPIVDELDDDAAWRGVADDYVITFGPESSAVRGSEAGLPILEASVGAFTRLWLGVRPATGLAVTDDLRGPSSVLAELDRILRLPTPKPDWDF
jgi:hypothetical protein